MRTGTRTVFYDQKNTEKCTVQLQYCIRNCIKDNIAYKYTILAL